MTYSKNISNLLITTGVLSASFFALTHNAFADEEVYLYVDRDGNFAAEVADTAAMAIDTAEARESNSGVIEADEFYSLTGEDMPVSHTLNAANMYGYVAMDGSIDYVVADSAEEALMLAPNRMADSGVIAAGELATMNDDDAQYLVSANSSLHQYAYVATDGTMRSVMAASAEEALILALNRMADSGVILLD